LRKIAKIAPPRRAVIAKIENLRQPAAWQDWQVSAQVAVRFAADFADERRLLA